MARLVSASVVAGFLLILSHGMAQAEGCDACQDTTCRQSCHKPSCCCSCEWTVMKKCKEIVYDEEEITLYKTVYEEVVDKHVIDAVKYVPETQYRCVPSTAWQPEQPCACAAPIVARPRVASRRRSRPAISGRFPTRLTARCPIRRPLKSLAWSPSRCPTKSPVAFRAWSTRKFRYECLVRVPIAGRRAPRNHAASRSRLVRRHDLDGGERPSPLLGRGPGLGD